MTHCECTSPEYQVKKDGSHLSPTKCMTRVSWRFDLLRDKQIKWMLPSSPITQLSNSISFLLHWFWFFFFGAQGLSCHAHAFSGMARYPRRPQIFNESHHFQIIYCLLLELPWPTNLNLLMGELLMHVCFLPPNHQPQKSPILII